MHRHRPSHILLTVLCALGLLGLAGCGGRSTPVAGPEATTTAPGSSVAADEPRRSPGCDGPVAPSPEDARRVVDIDGTERWYLLTAPESSPEAAPAPLVLDFHGLAEGATFHAEMTALGTLAQQEGFVLATPNGTGEPVAWGIGIDPTGADLRFVDALIDDVAATQCIDLRRVYATGLSNGALLSSALACASSNRIAAIATVAGIADPPGCRPERPVPVLNFHGTADAILLFNGGVGDLGSALSGGTPSLPAGYTPDPNGPGVPAAVAGWASRNGCEAAPSDDRIAADVIRRTYACPPEAEVVSYVIEGGGHVWPGSAVSASLERVIGRTTTSIDANELLWEFFQRHQLPVGA